MEKDKRGSGKGGSISSRSRRKSAPEGLEAEAGFEKWLAFLREHLGSAYSWNGPYASDLEKVEAIEAETGVLLQIAPDWSAEEFYSIRVAADPDFAKGSEHYVTRYLESGSPRIMKATIPGKYGRHEYSPSVYLNSWRLFQRFVPALAVRVHGVLAQPRPHQTPLPSIVTSMQYIEGGHPKAAQIGKYMRSRGWAEHTDRSETQDYINAELRQIIRDAHPGNWVKQTGTAELIPVDISIEQF